MGQRYWLIQYVSIFRKKRLHYIMGVFKDKEYETIIDQMSAFDADVITVETPGNPRALPAEELQKHGKRKSRCDI